MTRQSYETDITDAEWQLMEPLIPPARGGHPHEVDIREIVNGSFMCYKAAMRSA